ncbi:MAG: hypothetical protein WCP34_05815 [Pseudomonadota bacterium]
MHWIARINELIEAGQDATREESAKTLDGLLDLTPDDCWRLLQARDPRLNKLTADGYQHLLNKTVEARTSTILPGLPLLNPPGESAYPTPNSHDQRRDLDQKKPNDVSSLALVAPEIARRRIGLEGLVNPGRVFLVDTDTLTDMIH